MASLFDITKSSNYIFVLLLLYFFGFFFKQKTAYEIRIRDWSSDVCSSDLIAVAPEIWGDSKIVVDVTDGKVLALSLIHI